MDKAGVRSGLGKRIRKCREAFGASREQLAEKLGVQRPMIHQYEEKGSIPSPDKLMKLGELFGTTADWLLSGKGKAPVLPKEPLPERDPFELEEAQRIGEVRTNGNEAGFWRIPDYALPVAASQLVIFRSPCDLPPVKNGDYLFVDTADTDVAAYGHGHWLLNIAGIDNPIIAKTRLNGTSRGVELVLSDGTIVPIKTVRRVIGHVKARLNRI